MTKSQERHDHSAGGVAYRLAATAVVQVEVVLISTRNGSRWQLPKGAVEAHETPLQAAVREVEEESGVCTVHEHFLTTIAYQYRDTYQKSSAVLVHKRVDFFLLRVTGGELNDRSYEVDGVGWFTPAQALSLLTYAGEQTALRLAMEYWT